MTGALFLGWRYLAHHRFKSSILIASITLMLFLTAATRLLVEDSATALTARADVTPLILGARGSELELVLNTLYFHAKSPADIENRIFVEARSTGLADFIPIHSRFYAQGAPIVGTSLDYFDFRGLKIADGRQMGLLGESVIGTANGMAQHDAFTVEVGAVGVLALSFAFALCEIQQDSVKNTSCAAWHVGPIARQLDRPTFVASTECIFESHIVP